MVETAVNTTFPPTLSTQVGVGVGVGGPAEGQHDPPAAKSDKQKQHAELWHSLTSNDATQVATLHTLSQTNTQSTSDRRRRNRSDVDPREVRTAARRERRAVRSWTTIEAKDVAAAEELRRLQEMLHGHKGKHRLSRSRTSSQGDLSQSRPASVSSLSSASTACASTQSLRSFQSVESLEPGMDPPSPPSFAGQDGPSAAAGQASILADNFWALPPPPIDDPSGWPPPPNGRPFAMRAGVAVATTHAHAHAHPGRTDNDHQAGSGGPAQEASTKKWRTYRSDARDSPSPPPSSHDAALSASLTEPQQAVRLREEQTSFHGVTEAQLKQLQFFQLQRQRLQQQAAELAMTISASRAPSHGALSGLGGQGCPPPAHMAERLPSYGEAAAAMSVSGQGAHVHVQSGSHTQGSVRGTTRHSAPFGPSSGVEGYTEV